MSFKLALLILVVAGLLACGSSTEPASMSQSESPTTEDVDLESVGRLLQQGQVAEAIVELGKAIKLNPEMGSAYGMRGFVYFQLGLSQRALSDLNEAIRLDPQDAESYSNRRPKSSRPRARYLMLGQYQQAISDADVAIRLEPQRAGAYSNRASAYCQYACLFGQRCTAEVPVEGSISRPYRITRESASVIAPQKKVQPRQSVGALSDLNEAIPSRCRILLQSSSHLMLGQYQQAISDADVAIRLEPQRAGAYSNLRIGISSSINRPYRITGKPSSLPLRKVQPTAIAGSPTCTRTSRNSQCRT